MDNRVNTYRCEFGHITKTIDVDRGVTSFMHICATCGKLAHSSMYKDMAPVLDPVEEWYRPSLEELLSVNQFIHRSLLNAPACIGSVVADKHK